MNMKRTFLTHLHSNPDESRDGVLSGFRLNSLGIIFNNSHFVSPARNGRKNPNSHPKLARKTEFPVKTGGKTEFARDQKFPALVSGGNPREARTAEPWARAAGPMWAALHRQGPTGASSQCAPTGWPCSALVAGARCSSQVAASAATNNATQIFGIPDGV